MCFIAGSTSQQFLKVFLLPPHEFHRAQNYVHTCFNTDTIKNKVKDILQASARCDCEQKQFKEKLVDVTIQFPNYSFSYKYITIIGQINTQK